MNRIREVAAESRQLPEPSADALAHSERLKSLIKGEIVDQGGSISFARFMELALYAPGLGYYAAGSQKFGESGDFVTAPEISSLFSRCLARQCQQVLTELGGCDILEFGAGRGVMAADILQELEQLQCLPEHYFILELSADLRERQQQTIEERVPQLRERVVWLDALPNVPLNGVVLANEVLDAMPVELFQVAESGILRGQVVEQDEGFAIQFEHSSEGLLDPELIDLSKDLPTGYTSEYNSSSQPWLQGLAKSLGQAAVFLIDYGFPRHEFYHPQRDSGTLMCHYRHRSHIDPLILVGLQDITAHVDFTQVAEAALSAGFSVSGFTNQAYFLMSLGLTEMMAEVDPEDVARHMALSQQIKKLTMPNEMGELFKVIALNKDLDLIPRGFLMNDQRSRL